MTKDRASKVARHLRAITEIDPSATALHFDEQSFAWQDLRLAADALDAVMTAADIPAGLPIGWIASNLPPTVAGALGIAISDRCISPINPMQPAASLAAEIIELQMAAIVGDRKSWSSELIAAAHKAGTAGFMVSLEPPSAEMIVDPKIPGPAGYRDIGPEIFMERLSSGTTGAPKRIPVSRAVFAQSMDIALRSDRPGTSALLSLKRSPAVQAGPLGHAAGIFNLMMSLYHGRPLVLFERFDAERWADAIERFGIKFSSLVPTMIGMVLEADIAPRRLRSLVCVRSGTAPLDQARKRIFEKQYHIPILSEYGASEFMGGVAGWTLGLYRDLGAKKDGSVGRLRDDVEARIVDVSDANDLPFGQIGILVLRSPRWGPDWIPTTDLGSLDEDRFLWIHGRSDEAIIRGGFKVLPEKVAEILRMDPQVRDAAILAIEDPRLGAVPLAIVEMVDPTHLPSVETLCDLVRQNSPAYNIPAAFEFVASLPRTPSLKISRPALRSAFADRYNFV